MPETANADTQPMKATVVDATHLKLDHPIPIRTGQEVYVVFCHQETEQDEETQWQAASRDAFAKLYDQDEPDYSYAMIKENNADYQA